MSNRSDFPLGDRLGHKLVEIGPALLGSAEPPLAKTLCLLTDDRFGFLCEFKTEQGVLRQFPFHRLVCTELDAEGTILEAQFAEARITIQGRNLQSVATAFARARHLTVQAVGARSCADYQPDETYVKSIDFQSLESADPTAAQPDDAD